MAKLVHLSPGDELANGRYRVEREMNRAHVRLVEHRRRRVALSRQVRTCAGGGTAIIYAAVDRAESESRVALKVVPLQPSAAMPSGALCREVQYAQILRHENIARCLGAFHAAHIGAFVIVTELVDGIDLLEFLNSRTDPLSEAEARHIFKQVLSAVTFLHNNGFVHRDLKPENVVIEQPLQHAKLVDFGLVKRFMSAKTVFCGTLDYNAPEMIEQPADAHPAFGRPYDPAKSTPLILVQWS